MLQNCKVIIGAYIVSWIPELTPYFAHRGQANRAQQMTNMPFLASQLTWVIRIIIVYFCSATPFHCLALHSYHILYFGCSFLFRNRREHLHCIVAISVCRVLLFSIPLAGRWNFCNFFGRFACSHFLNTRYFAYATYNKIHQTNLLITRV